MPNDETMATLAAIADAVAIECLDDWNVVAVARDGTETPVPDAHLTALVGCGYLDPTDLPDGKGGENLHLNVTGAGLYWLGRWLKAKQKGRAKR